MVIDASAILAILLDEPEREAFTRAIVLAGGGVMSPVNYWEVLARMHAHDGAEGRADAELLISKLGIRVARTTSVEARAAADAFARWGKRSEAGLNLGDCFAYALADGAGEALLYKGNDFSKTDIESGLEV